MTRIQPLDANIAVIGLGYVGLPLALALARHFPVRGFDSNAERLEELRGNDDKTGEVAHDVVYASTLKLVAAPTALVDCNIFIVAVPTPIDSACNPNLSPLKAASRQVGKLISPGNIVVFESTVYPGVTEEICGAELEKTSGLKSGVDFFLGYSPERINPGDTIHTLEKVVKVVAGQTPEVATLLANIYGAAVDAGIHLAPDIRTAEAAKVIENAQRDINIAFINEVAMIFKRMGINTQDVFDAARTKWNFLDFKPGLVGGHCIGVDPFYLAHAAKAVNHEPEVILAGRRINDGMAKFIACEIDSQLKGPSRILILGLTFKENVPDLRNSKIVDMIGPLRERGHNVEVHDPIAAASDAKVSCGIDLISSLTDLVDYDAIVGAVAHEAYRELTASQIEKMLAHGGLLVDLKGIWRELKFSQSLRQWIL